MAKTLPTCKTCPFVVPSTPNAALEGWCHEGPPQFFFNATNGLPSSIYPPVALGDIGCGKHPKWPRPR